MGNRNYFSALTESFGRGWDRFWFTPVDPLPCCNLRILAGAIATAYLLSLIPDLTRWYARDGLLPPAAVNRLLELLAGGEATNYHVSYLSVFPVGAELWIVHAAALAAAVAFLLGLFTRIAGALTLVAVLAYVHRVPFVAGDLEPVLAYLLAYLLIAPAGERLSIDRWLLRRRTSNAEAESPSLSVAANVSLRLIQVHSAMFVAMMGFSKLYGDAWWGGGAIWLLIAQTESRPLDLTGLRSAGQLGEYVLNFWAHAIVYVELAFPILVWNRLARPIVLVLAAAAWLSLALVTGSLFLALALIAASASFVSAASYRQLIGQPALLPSSA